MSMTGTTIAQAVAAAPHAAQQVARTRDRREVDRERAVRRVRDAFEAHLLALEESEQEQFTTRLHVDQRLPDRSIADEWEEAQRRQREQQKASDESAEQPESSSTPVEPPQPAPGSPLYRHLDLTA